MLKQQSERACEMVSRLRFRHIEGFRAVMMTGSVTGAASVLRVSQPAVSRTIHELEHVVGLKLFDRRGRRLVPTVTAELLREEVERCFVGIDSIDAFCRRQRTADRRINRLVAVPSGSLVILPGAIRGYRETVAPDVFHISTRNTDIVIGWVSSQKADLGIGSKPLRVPGIVCEPIGAFDSVCALPVGDPLARKLVVHVRDLDGRSFISLGRAEGARHRVDELLEEYDVTPNEVVESPMVSAACAMVRAGLGVALVDQYASSLFLNGEVILRRFEPAVTVTTYAYWTKDGGRNLDCERFADIVKTVSSEVTRRVNHFIDYGQDGPKLVPARTRGLGA
jgi:DNA-binding transcriptional LysR family regulator